MKINFLALFSTKIDGCSLIFLKIDGCNCTHWPTITTPLFRYWVASFTQPKAIQFFKTKDNIHYKWSWKWCRWKQRHWCRDSRSIKANQKLQYQYKYRRTLRKWFSKSQYRNFWCPFLENQKQHWYQKSKKDSIKRQKRK